MGRIATLLAMGESRIAALRQAGVVFSRTRTGIAVGDVLRSVNAGTRLASHVYRTTDLETGEEVALVDVAPHRLSEANMSDREIAILQSAGEAASGAGLPLRAALSLENLSAGEIARALRALNSVDAEAIDLSPVQVSDKLLLYAVATSGAAVLTGAAVGALVAGLSSPEWAQLRALASADSLASLKRAAGRYTADDAAVVSLKGGAPLPAPLEKLVNTARDPGLRSRILTAVPPIVKDDVSSLLGHLAMTADAMAPAVWMPARLTSVRQALTPAALLAAVAVAAEAAPGDEETSAPFVGQRAFTSAGIAASALWDPNRRIDGHLRPHKGADFPVAIGTKVPALGPGVVRWVRFDGRGGGLSLDVLYDSINGKTPLLVTYRHLSRTLQVEGARVAKGAILALTGNTSAPSASGGRGSTGAHLHVEARVLRFGRSTSQTQKAPGTEWDLVPVESIFPRA